MVSRWKLEGHFSNHILSNFGVFVEMLYQLDFFLTLLPLKCLAGNLYLKKVGLGFARAEAGSAITAIID
jgi:hypothetical protein|tara:strand:- start:228 stop:434 length:207 start_codon:yes stop_codon:yes gene_type:complete